MKDVRSFAGIPLPLYHPRKPKDVVYAEIALWVWTVWACLYGIFHTWKQIPEIEDLLNLQMQGMVSIDPGTMLHMAIGGYVTVAIISAWFVYKIGKGRPWARSSLLWGFGFEAVVALTPPYHGLIELLSEIPELGLQIYAIYLLYTPPSRAWFDHHK